MGYESKLIIINRTTWKGWDPLATKYVNYAFGEEIATFKLSCMGNNFNHKEIFSTPIDFDLYSDGEATREDCYGEHCGMAHLADVIEVLHEFAAKDDYRRLMPCISLLNGFDESRWDELVVVHWGY